MTNRILIVDDEPKNLDVLHNCLREADFKVMIAKSGEAAIKRIAHTKPDLILLDINMPGIDGYETYRRLKNNELSKDTPVIFVTAETETVDTVRGLEMGAADYITKPFQPEEVAARIERHLTIRNLQKRLEEQNAQLQREIAERKRAEEALRESEGKYRGLFERLNEAMYRMSLPDGKYEYMSPAARKIFGYSAEEFMENPLLIRKVIHPDFAEYFKEKWADLIEDKFPPTYTFKILDPEGNERWIVQSNTGMFDDSGNIIAIEGLCRDITKEVQAEETLRESENNLKQAQKVSRVGSWDLDVVTGTLYWSDETYRLYGFKPQEFAPTYENFQAIIHLEDHERVQKAVDAALSSAADYDIDFRFIRSDGQTGWIHCDGQVTHDGEGKPIRFFGTQIDITERKQAEEALRASEEQLRSSLKEKEILLSEIHHRVKNNMQVISSLLKLQSAQIEDKKYTDMFKDSENRIKSMALVHETLYQSKDFANVDFNGYVEAITNHLIRNSATHPDKIKLKREIEDITFGLDHAIPCGLIINELITNSLKYAFPKGREGEIKVTFRSINHDEIELTVSDDGIGIPGEMDIREAESLGLQLVHILAEDQLEGTLELDRDGGTAFRIRFKEAHNENSGTSISKQLGT